MDVLSLDDFEEFIEYIQYVYENRIPRTYIRNNECPFNVLTDDEFKKRYRFSKECVNDVIMPLVMSADIEMGINRGLPIPLRTKLLTALRFYATGSMQIVCGDHSISQSTVSRIIAQISETLARHLGRYIKFPPTHEATHNCKRVFYEIGRFPDVVGCIDGTHIPIKNPGGPRPEIYRNRKGWISLNVQVVSGPNMEIFNIVIRWPGSANDNRIFENSNVMVAFEERRVSGILLGDTGYVQRQYLFTPVRHPQNEAEIRYNCAHEKTRNVIERLFGVWKMKFTCLTKKLNTKLKTTTRIIAACAILHNIGLEYDADVTHEYSSNEHPDRVVPAKALEDGARGKAIRAAFINRHFN